MAEISREEAHNILDIFLDKQVDLERTLHHSTYTDNEIWSAVKRAYDDMEKLEKIEHILFPRDNMCGGQLCATCDYEGGVDCINERQIDLCKQILTEQ